MRYAEARVVRQSLFVAQVGCEDAALGLGTEEAAERLCRRILVEAKAIAHAAYPPLLRDLFAEQGKQEFELAQIYRGAPPHS